MVSRIEFYRHKCLRPDMVSAIMYNDFFVELKFTLGMYYYKEVYPKLICKLSDGRERMGDVFQ